jgi:hypothetical protein
MPDADLAGNMPYSGVPGRHVPDIVMSFAGTCIQCCMARYRPTLTSEILQTKMCWLMHGGGSVLGVRSACIL